MEVMERENRSKAMILSILLHIAFFLFLYYYRFDAPSGTTDELTTSGPIEIDFGGGGDDAQQGLPDAGGAVGASEPEPIPEPAPTEPIPTTTPSKPISTPPIATTDDADVKALRLRQQAERKAELERQQLEQQRLEAIRAAEELERQRAAEKKKSYGSAFGNNKKPGTAGSPNGSGNNPSGTSGGSGGGSGGGVGTSIGGGIGNRAVRSKPPINYNTNDEGIVYVEVVVDQNGNVTRAIIKGNSDPNANLQQIARKAALEFKFDPASSPEQRGVITFNFRLKRAGQ